jgi:hypothetical protein
MNLFNAETGSHPFFEKSTIFKDSVWRCWHNQILEEGILQFITTFFARHVRMDHNELLVIRVWPPLKRHASNPVLLMIGLRPTQHDWCSGIVWVDVSVSSDSMSNVDMLQRISERKTRYVKYLSNSATDVACRLHALRKTLPCSSVVYAVWQMVKQIEEAASLHVLSFAVDQVFQRPYYHRRLCMPSCQLGSSITFFCVFASVLWMGPCVVVKGPPVLNR